jgi:serine/threonine protein kinase
LTGIQAILYIASEKDIKCESNYSITVYAEFLNFSLKKHLDGLRFRGESLSDKEIFYILREMTMASSYLTRKKLKVRSFDPSNLFLSSKYEVKIPYESITYENSIVEDRSRHLQSFTQLQPQHLVLCLSPE